MEFFSALNMAIIGGIIVIIETIKYFLSKKFIIADDVWKIIVIGAGAIAALIVTDWSNFIFQTFLQNTIMYAGLATIIYQSGKLGIIKIKGLLDKNGK